MCLDYVTNNPIELEFEKGIGYKSITPGLDTLSNIPFWRHLWYPDGANDYGKWYEVPIINHMPPILIAFDGERYRNGYHIWLRPRTVDYDHHTLNVKVEYADILARGGNAGPTIVARKMRVIGLEPRMHPMFGLEIYNPKSNRNHTIEISSDEYKSLIPKLTS